MCGGVGVWGAGVCGCVGVGVCGGVCVCVCVCVCDDFINSTNGIAIYSIIVFFAFLIKVNNMHRAN